MKVKERENFMTYITAVVESSSPAMRSTTQILAQIALILWDIREQNEAQQDMLNAGFKKVKK